MAKAEKKFRDNVKGFKYKTIEAMIKFVKGHMSTKESFLRRQDRIGLRLYFEKKYSPENFVNIYRHLDGFLDITGSTALGKHYCIAMWSNLAAEAATFVLAGADASARQTLVNTFTSFSLSQI
ncbi:hypothetical protein B0A50_05449 [Salinomyces thailandicus]|uniref:Uncharacterized protein n=1 Tax=Salinomyces thailandicus TaxID=706561 RepID=A0A4U0TTQ0_9PEZI|nr:hypothetical protein B0A50_05449 [Salinomyces thailandica]